MIEQAHAPGKASRRVAAPVLREQGVRMSSLPPDTQDNWHDRRERQTGRQGREMAFSGGGIMMIYLLAPLCPLLASLGLSLIPPRSQAHPHIQPGWSPVWVLLPHSLHLLPTLLSWWLLCPLPSWNPSPPPSIPVQLWEEVPKTLRISSLSWAASGPFVTVSSVLCRVCAGPR